MDFCFGLIAIFLILDMTFVRSTGNFSSKKKRNLNNTQLGFDIVTDSLRQTFISRSSIENNPSLQPLNSKKKRNSFLSNEFASQVPDIVFPDDNLFIFLSKNNNTFLNPIKTDTQINNKSDSLRPVTQTPYIPLSNHTSASLTQVSDIPVFSTPALDNDFTTSRTSTPPKIRPSNSHLSWNDLLSLKKPMKPISERKCEEYVREIAGMTSIISLSNSSSDVRKMTNTCGSTNRLVPRSIASIQARVNEFPHMVALGTRNIDEFILVCGGSLISHTWVLSAAQCVNPLLGPLTVVKMGTNKLSDQEAIMVDIKHIIRHPDYKPPMAYADIALIQLINAVTFSTVIRPACLYQQYDAVPRKIWITGWGVTSFDGDFSDELQKTQLDVVDNMYCSVQYNISRRIPYGVTPSMICAGDPRGNWTKDSCQGDSGGPLQVQPEGACLYQVVGIVSFGRGCGLPTIPSIYTRVSYYLSWIEDIVWPQEQ